MLYSKLSPVEKHIILDGPDNYPLRVAFLGKRGLLSQSEIEFLIRHGVDFDMDEGQTARILGKASESRAAANVEAMRPTLAAFESMGSGSLEATKRHSHRLLFGCLLGLLAAAPAGLIALVRIIRALRAGRRR